jgi:ATP-dependent Clp protease ATP-binding subunit ClpC
MDYKVMHEKIEASVKKHFKPEFINRLDGLVIFHTLDKTALRQVVDLEFGKLKDRLLRKNINLTLDDCCRDFLVEKSYIPEMGARPLRRTIEQYLEDPLAEKVLHQPTAVRTFFITLKDNSIAFIDQTPLRTQPGVHEDLLPKP